MYMFQVNPQKYCFGDVQSNYRPMSSRLLVACIMSTCFDIKF